MYSIISSYYTNKKIFKFQGERDLPLTRKDYGIGNRIFLTTTYLEIIPRLSMLYTTSDIILDEGEII